MKKKNINIESEKERIVKGLKEADWCLEKEGYKTWCYARLSISEAINALRDCESNVDYIFDPQKHL